METTDYKSADKKRYAISTKAYNDFVDRIRDSLEDMYCWACEDALQLLNAAVEYDNDDPIDIMDCEIEAQVAFLMIKPEIKRAIKRSRAARERAARRKSMAAAEAVASVENVESAVAIEPTEGVASGGAVATALVIENRDAENTTAMRRSHLRRRLNAMKKHRQQAGASRHQAGRRAESIPGGRR